MGAANVTLADLPRFVQKRAYDKGIAVARVVVVHRDKDWFFDRPLIEGTRLDARDVAAMVARYGDEGAELVHQVYPWLTYEQINAAVAWDAAHPKWRPKR